jgi:hypothetical protein
MATKSNRSPSKDSGSQKPPITLVNPNLNFTRGNHFECGYDGTPFIMRTSPQQRWWVRYGRCPRPVFDWRTECVLGAKEISSTFQSDVVLCFSGGIDSQVMVAAFVQAKVKFRVAILRFANDLNIHDISWAVVFCEEHGIPYEFYELNLADFFESGEMLELATETRCLSPMLPAQMKVMAQVSRSGGVPILGSAEVYLKREKGVWRMSERERIASLYRYLVLHQMRGVPGFFQWNPEMIYSFLIDPKVKNLVSNKMVLHGSTWFAKHEIYAQHFDILPREKYTGFEKIMKLDAKHRPHLEKAFADSDEVCWIPYKELVDYFASGIQAGNALIPSQHFDFA